MWCALAVLACAAGGAAGGLAERDVYRLPQLYVLDDYDRCLARPGALYCVGTFRLSAARQAPAPHYRLMEEYSSNPHHFDRTLLHRGYCVSARCPDGPNSTQGFLDCVREQERGLGLEVSLQSHHCERAEPAPAPAHWDVLFAWSVALLVALNAAGTLYDVSTTGKNKLLLAWSVRSSWRALTSPRQAGHCQRSTLAPIQGLRVTLMLLVIIVHAVITSHLLFLANPHYIEELEYHPAVIFAKNGAPLVQSFVVLSTFFMAYNILSKNKELSFASLPKYILRRMARILPLHLLVVGFAATWWRHTGDGPQWAGVVGAESAVCRRKFLLHAFFLHNLVDKDEHCLVQTWFLAVDFQLYIVASVLLTALARRRRSLPVLGALCVAACLLNGALAYYYDWQSFHSLMLPENSRVTFRGSPSFRDYYLSPWGSLPACLMGLMLAHVYHHLQRQNADIRKNKVVRWLYRALPLAPAWAAAEALAGRPWPLSSAVLLERPVFALLSCVLLLGLITHADGAVARALAWRGWHALGSLNLAVLLLHWCLNKTLVAQRRTLLEFSVRNTTMEVCATVFVSYAAALPLTLLVELPVMQTYDTLTTHLSTLCHHRRRSVAR